MPRCNIYGGPHRPQVREQQEVRCFKYGQPGHILFECPQGDGRAPSVASAPFSPRRLTGIHLRYYATIDCESHVVTFGAPGHEYVYRGSTVVDDRKGSSTLDDRKRSPTLEDISIVQEFSDVFLAEFAINLLLGTVSISNAAYRMALVELKKLKA
uniref:CCHC-type domain-containing protein n=1 Tax=Ananas comosus var. bracteatus TaxID=296719 RepID=A0A6V7PEH8_ANACO|nr:unnamed protein product [Ananas comosus var. bracteatus]